MGDWAAADGGEGMTHEGLSKKKKEKTKTNSFVRSESARWPHGASEEQRQRAMNM